MHLSTQAFGQGSSAVAVGPRQFHGLRRHVRHHHVFMKMLFEDQGGTRGFNYNAATTKTGLGTEEEDFKTQAELIPELQLGLKNKHIELPKYRYAEDRNRTREQGKAPGSLP